MCARSLECDRPHNKTFSEKQEALLFVEVSFPFRCRSGSTPFGFAWDGGVAVGSTLKVALPPRTASTDPQLRIVSELGYPGLIGPVVAERVMDAVLVVGVLSSLLWVWRRHIWFFGLLRQMALLEINLFWMVLFMVLFERPKRP